MDYWTTISSAFELPTPLVLFDARQIATGVVTSTPNLGSLGGNWTAPLTGPDIQANQFGTNNGAFFTVEDNRMELPIASPITGLFLITSIFRRENVGGFRHVFSSSHSRATEPGSPRQFKNGALGGATSRERPPNISGTLVLWDTTSHIYSTSYDTANNFAQINATTQPLYIDGGHTDGFDSTIGAPNIQESIVLGSGQPTQTNQHMEGWIGYLRVDQLANLSQVPLIHNAIKTEWGL